MGDTASLERRQHPRHPLCVAVELCHSPTGREYPARSVDVSQGGVLMLIPPTAPIQPGHAVRLTLRYPDKAAEPTADRDSTSAPHEPDDTVRPFCRDIPLSAEVVRVDRQQLLASGQLAVAVRFSH